jgi:KGK domain
VINEKSRVLNQHDVVNTKSNILINHETFTSSEFLEKMREPLSITRSDRAGYEWIGEGIDCEVLACHNNTQGWQAGKLRIVLEFIPNEILEPTNQRDNESDSPLDGIRQMT